MQVNWTIVVLAFLALTVLALVAIFASPTLAAVGGIVTTILAALLPQAIAARPKPLPRIAYDDEEEEETKR